MGTLTPSQEHYLKAIFMLSSTSGSTRICDVAEELNVKKPSVCTAVKTLEHMALVKRDGQRQIILTPKGKNQAYLIKNKFSIIRCYLIEILGIDEEAAELDACAIEHVVSNETLCSMCRQTGKDICSEDCYLKIETEFRQGQASLQNTLPQVDKMKDDQ